MPPKVLKLQEIDPPAELAAALDDNFLRALRISAPPPVRIAAAGVGAVAWCENEQYQEQNEVVIRDWRAPSTTSKVHEWIRGIYIHEAAHRLVGQADAAVAGHGLEFFTMQLFLFSLLGKREDGSGLDWWTAAALYDCQDLFYDAWPAPATPGQCIDWALAISGQLWAESQKKKEITAEFAAQEICRRAKAWRAELEAELGEKAALRRAANEKVKMKDENKIRVKIVWRRAGLVALAVASVLVMLTMGRR